MGISKTPSGIVLPLPPRSSVTNGFTGLGTNQLCIPTPTPREMVAEVNFATSVGRIDKAVQQGVRGKAVSKGEGYTHIRGLWNPPQFFVTDMAEGVCQGKTQPAHGTKLWDTPTKLPIKGHKKIDGRKAHCAVEKGRQVTHFGVTPQRDGFNLPAGNGWQTRLRVEAGRLGMCRSLRSKTLFTPAFAVAHRVHKPPVLHRMVALQIPPTLNSLLFCRGDWRI